MFPPRTPIARRAVAGFLLAAAATLATISTGLTASNVVPGSRAGDGTSTVSGYTVAGVGYTLNAATPTNVDAVTFTISPTSATSVRAKLAGAWYSCTNSSGSVSCPTTSPQATVGAVSSLQVVAVG